MRFFGKCVYVYWKLTLWTRDGLGGRAEGVHRREESRICLVLWQWGQRMRGRSQQVACSRAGDGTGGLDVEED